MPRWPLSPQGFHAKAPILTQSGYSTKWATAAIHIDEVRAGRGVLDYRVYLSELARLPEDTPLMIEHLKMNEEYSLAADYIRGIAAQVGVSFN